MNSLHIHCFLSGKQKLSSFVSLFATNSYQLVLYQILKNKQKSHNVTSWSQMLKLIYFYQPVIIFLSVLPQKIQVPHIFVIKTEILSNFPAK